MKKIIIGSRGSELSLKQVDIIKGKLHTLDRNLEIEIKIIHTKGDKNMSPIPLDSIGKGWFTKEIDKSTIDGTIDMAIHSLKDLPESLPPGLIIACIPEREDPREVLISKTGLTLEKLPIGSIIGTDSNRRKSQILHMRPDLIIKSIRGNVNTRLAKLENENYDAIMLAAAGLRRLNKQERITQYFSLTDIIPSPGQGALAVVIKQTEIALLKFLKKLDHKPTLEATIAERAFSAAIGGGCKTPVGAYAEISDDKLTLWGLVGSLDGKNIAKDTIEGPAAEAKKIGQKLAKKLLKTSAPWYRPLIVITRSAADNQHFKQKLEKIGFSVLDYPCIQTTPANLSNTAQDALKQIKSFDWIIFTSSKGVSAFMNKVDKLVKTDLKSINFAAVGPKTAEAIESYGLSASFIPSHFTTQHLGSEIPNIHAKKILLPRANIASKLLTQTLEKRGAQVTNITIYDIHYPTPDNEKIKKLILEDKIGYITFTSPSTVKGFLKSLKPTSMNNEPLLKKVKQIPILSIGPVTTQAAQKADFTNITTASPHTIEGMINIISRRNNK